MAISPETALQRLRDGNARFIDDNQPRYFDSVGRAALADGQNPFAVVLGCSDSRVPVEIVFDQGLGDLFVIRVAGNVVAPSLIGSIEFAAQKFDARLVVVLGHTRCGAVEATLEAMQRPEETESRNIASIVERVRPAVEALLDEGESLDEPDLIDRAVRRNVQFSVDAIRHGSPMIESLIRDQRLLIVGAEYSLATGVVDFFAGVPDPASAEE
ncbi:MAG: carbonic anhydrase [Woeseiaceae bacterium]|nr:carbonic anhydrase [Woeseiaceae bacterium]